MNMKLNSPYYEVYISSRYNPKPWIRHREILILRWMLDVTLYGFYENLKISKIIKNLENN